MTENLPAKRAELVASGDVSAIVPRDIDEAWRLAEVIVKAGLAPDSYKNDPKAIVVGIMKSLEVGLPPLTGINNIAIINGRPCIWGDGAVALAQNSGYIADIEADQTEPTPQVELQDWPDTYGWNVSITRAGHGSGTYTGSFTVGDAKRAKLWLNHRRRPWIEYPDRMLFNRARAFALRDGFADALMGLAIREEMEDVPTPKPEAPETPFLDEGLADEPEASVEPAGEPEDTSDTEPASEVETATGEPPSAPEDDFDYVGQFQTVIQSLDSRSSVEKFWENSEPTRRERSEDEQRQMSAIYADRWNELPEGS